MQIGFYNANHYDGVWENYIIQKGQLGLALSMPIKFLDRKLNHQSKKVNKG